MAETQLGKSAHGSTSNGYGEGIYGRVEKGGLVDWKCIQKLLQFSLSVKWVFFFFQKIKKPTYTVSVDNFKCLKVAR